MSDADDAAPARFTRPRPPHTCPGTENVVQELIERLRARRDELAAAVAGRALSIEVVLGSSVGTYRVGVAGEGYVTTLSDSNPLTLGFSPDVVVQGSANEVVEVLTAEEPMAEAVHLVDPNSWPRYARVHRIVALELRGML